MNIDIFNLLLFNISLVAIMLFVWRLFPWLGTVGLPIIPAGFVLVCFLIFISSLVPGVLGILTPVSVSTASITLALAAIYLLGLISPDPLSAKIDIDDPGDRCVSARAGKPLIAAAAFFSLIGVILAARYIFRILWGLFDPQRPLTLDVVVHNLPGFIKFIQDKTLWSMKGPFASYSFGYELIGGFPAYFFKSHWHLYLADLFSIIFITSVLFSLTKSVLRIWRPGAACRVWPYFIVLWTSWFYLFRPDKLHVGKNGIFLNACILTSFLLVLEMVLGERGVTTGRRYRWLFAVSSLSAGLALSVKPNSLGFVLFLPLGLLFGLFMKEKEHGRVTLQPVIHSAVFFLIAMATGGFFFLRNLLFYGSIVDPALSRSAFSMTILNNLADPRFYILNRDIILLPIAVVIFMALLIKAWKNRTSENRLVLLLLFTAYYLVAFISFVLTPFVVFTMSEKGATLDFRQGMMLVTAMLIGILILLHSKKEVSNETAGSDWKPPAFLEKVQRKMIEIGGRKTLLNLSLVLLFVLVNTTGWYWAKYPTEGMPGYENFRNIPESSIYSYAQGLDGPVKIYASGLFPYGLYDHKWENEVRFALSTDELSPENVGREKIIKMLKDYKPQYLLISAAHKFPPEPQSDISKPLYSWIKGNGECFEEVYSDSGASAFKVRDGCVITAAGLGL